MDSQVLQQPMKGLAGPTFQGLGRMPCVSALPVSLRCLSAGCFAAVCSRSLQVCVFVERAIPLLSM
jgi:hypothetical protein